MHAYEHFYSIFRCAVFIGASADSLVCCGLEAQPARSAGEQKESRRIRNATQRLIKIFHRAFPLSICNVHGFVPPASAIRVRFAVPLFASRSAAFYLATLFLCLRSALVRCTLDPLVHLSLY